MKKPNFFIPKNLKSSSERGPFFDGGAGLNKNKRSKEVEDNSFKNFLTRITAKTRRQIEEKENFQPKTINKRNKYKKKSTNIISRTNYEEEFEEIYKSLCELKLNEDTDIQIIRDANILMKEIKEISKGVGKRHFTSAILESMLKTFRSKKKAIELKLGIEGTEESEDEIEKNLGEDCEYIENAVVHEQENNIDPILIEKTKGKILSEVSTVNSGSNNPNDDDEFEDWKQEDCQEEDWKDNQNTNEESNLVTLDSYREEIKKITDISIDGITISKDPIKKFIIKLNKYIKTFESGINFLDKNEIIKERIINLEKQIKEFNNKINPLDKIIDNNALLQDEISSDLSYIIWIFNRIKKNISEEIQKIPKKRRVLC